MDIGRAFGYPMKDQNWIVKLLIGAVVSLIPLVNLIGTGFQLRATREVLRGNENTLPEWDDWGGDFVRGLVVAIFSFIYFLPMTIVYCCVSVLAGVLNGEDGSGAGSLLLLCILPFMLVYAVIAGALLAPAYVRYAATDDYNVYLDFGGRLNDVRNTSSDLIMLVIYVMVIGFTIGLIAGLTFWICGLGLLFAFAAQLMIAHLLGQYGQRLGLGDAPLFSGASVV